MKHAALGAGGEGNGGMEQGVSSFSPSSYINWKKHFSLIFFIIFACLFVFRINLGKVNVKGRLLHILAQ